MRHPAVRPLVEHVVVALQPRGDIHALAVDVVALDDHVAQVDADAQDDALALGFAFVARGHAALALGGAFHRRGHPA